MVVRFFCAARPLRQSTADKEHSHEPEHESECERDGPEIQWQRPVGRQTQGIAFLVRQPRHATRDDGGLRKALYAESEPESDYLSPPGHALTFLPKF